MRRSIFSFFLWPAPVLIIGIGIVLAMQLQEIQRQRTLDTAVSENSQLLTQLRAFRTYYSENIVKKALDTGALQTSTDYKSSSTAIPFPATFLHDLGIMASGKSRDVEVFSPFPFRNRAGRILSDVQTEAWDKLSRVPDETFVKRFSREGQDFLMIAVADRMAAQGCVSCHNSHPDSPKRDWKLGDVRAVMAASVPLADMAAHDAEMRNRIWLIVGGTLTVALLLYFCIFHLASARLARAVHALRCAVEGDTEIEVPPHTTGDEADRIYGAVRSYLERCFERDALLAERAKDSCARMDRVARLRRIAEKFDGAARESLARLKDVSHRLSTSSKSLELAADTVAGDAAVAGDAGTTFSTIIGAAEVRELSDQLARDAEELEGEMIRFLETIRAA